MTFSAFLPPGDLVDQWQGLVDARSGVGGSEFRGHLQLERHRVDGEDALGAGQARALDRRGPEAADADDDHVVAGPDISGIDRRSPAGGDSATDQARLVQRIVIEDLDAGRLVDHGVLGEGAQAHHRGQVLAARRVVAVGPVGLSSHHELGADVAQIRVTAGARGAFAAGRDESEDHVVARAQALDPGADLLHHAGALVTSDDRVHAPEVAGPHVLVAVAHPRCGDSDQDLVRLRRVEPNRLDLPVLTDAPEDRCFRFHVHLIWIEPHDCRRRPRPSGPAPHLRWSWDG